MAEKTCDVAAFNEKGERVEYVRVKSPRRKCLTCKKPIAFSARTFNVRQSDGTYKKMIAYQNRYFHSQRCAAVMAEWWASHGLVRADPEIDIVVDGQELAGPLVPATKRIAQKLRKESIEMLRDMNRSRKDLED